MLGICPHGNIFWICRGSRQESDVARPLRFVYPGAVYHVMALGDGGRNGFRALSDGLVILPKGELAQWPLKREDLREVTGEGHNPGIQ
jgi:hypothetical protein